MQLVGTSDATDTRQGTGLLTKVMICLKGSIRQSVEESNTEGQDQESDINKFVHYYIRYKQIIVHSPSIFLMFLKIQEP